MKTRLSLLIFFSVICLGFCEDDPLVFSTKECHLKEPVYDHIFNFTDLKSDFSHKVVSASGDIVDYNMCGNINRSCDGQKNVAACLKRGNKEYVLGREFELNYSRGKMFFTYFNGSKCPFGNGDFKLHVIIGCDYTVDKDQSQITPYAKDACSFYITFETPSACLPQPEAIKSNVCSVQDMSNHYIYNLLPLSDVNYRLTDRRGSALVINVCKPVLYGENAMCPPGSSICFINLKSDNFKKKYYNYGTVQAGPIIENGKLLMRHTSETKCNETHNFSSIINFYCAKDVKNAHPELIDDRDCVYKFSFATPLACHDLEPCTIMSHGNEIIDLRPLANHTFTLNVTNKQYSFSVCSAAQSPCLENDGACLVQDHQTTSLGTRNKILRFNQNGSLYLLYEGGSKCAKTGDDNSSNEGTMKTSATSSYWSTKIEFICVPTENNGSADARAGNEFGKAARDLSPKIIEDSNCQLLIHYETPLACHEQIRCYDKAYVEHSEDGTGMELVNLSPLINPIRNYEAQINTNLITSAQIGKSTKFFLNVCRALVPEYSWSCSGGSAGCMAEISSSSKAEKEKSLGLPLASLRTINRTTAELLYLQGDQCPTDKDSRLSSRILFHCDRKAGHGQPILENITDCHYQFKWATNVICPPDVLDFNRHGCEIINKDLDKRINLHNASFTNSGTIYMKLESDDFTFNLCEMNAKLMTDYSQGLVNVFFTTRNYCEGNAILNVLMRLICSNRTERTTTYFSRADCNLVFEQRTPEICAFLGLSTVDTPTGTTSSNADVTPTTTSKPAKDLPEQKRSLGAILGAILSLIFVMGCMGVLLFSPQRRHAVRRLFRRSTSVVRYSRVQSNEEANLLLEPNGEFTDSDDDMLL